MIFTSPSGLNFTQVNPLIQQLEKCVKSSDLQVPRELWERSNCPSLNSLRASHRFPSCLSRLTPPSVEKAERAGLRRAALCNSEFRGLTSCWVLPPPPLLLFGKDEKESLRRLEIKWLDSPLHSFICFYRALNVSSQSREPKGWRAPNRFERGAGNEQCFDQVASQPQQMLLLFWHVQL